MKNQGRRMKKETLNVLIFCPLSLFIYQYVYLEGANKPARSWRVKNRGRNVKQIFEVIREYLLHLFAFLQIYRILQDGFGTSE
jgi:hypothetical protein